MKMRMKMGMNIHLSPHSFIPSSLSHPIKSGVHQRTHVGVGLDEWDDLSDGLVGFFNHGRGL